MANKIVETVQELVDKTSDRRKLGKVHEVKYNSFKYTRQNLLTPSTDKPNDQVVQTNNISWYKIFFQHDRGPYLDLTLQDFNTNHILEKDVLSSDNGNFVDRLIRANANVKYSCRVGVDRVTSMNLRIVAIRSSVSVYLTNEENKSTTQLFSSGAGGFYTESIIPVTFTLAGNWTLTILYYRQEAGGEIKVSGNLGSYVHALEGPQKLPKTVPTINTSFSVSGIESKFVDGANGPSLSNIVYWDKLDPDQDAFGGQNIAGYGLYEIQPQELSYTVVSGWGTDGFVVSNNKRSDFPIISKVTIDSTEYTVSGTQFFSDINQTLINLSGTSFSGNPSDTITVDRDYHIIDLPNKASLNQIVSGIHYNVIAGRLYSYQVDTYNEIGERGDRTAKISITAGDFTPPGQVTGLTASGTLKGIELTWTNPNDTDLKGIHIWDKNSIVSGTDFPLQTLLKGSQGTIPNKTVVANVSSGTLIDNWPYTFYVSTFDWAGNEDAQNMPSVTETTAFTIKTSQEGQRIETDSESNQLRFYAANNDLLLTIGEDILGERDGVLINNGIVRLISGSGNIYITGETVFGQTSKLGGIVSTLNTYGSTGGSQGIVGQTVDASENNLPVNRVGVYGLSQVLGASVGNTKAVAVYGNAFHDSDDSSAYAGYFDGANVFTTHAYVMQSNGSAPDIPASTGSLFTVGGEVFVRDAAANSTQISPHDPITNEWIFFSKNVRTGKVKRINMEKVIRKLEELTGEIFIEEWVE